MVCQLWFKRFMNGNESVEDQGRSSKSLDIDDSLSDLVSSDPFLSSREMAETLHTSHTTMLSHLRDLVKTLKYGRWLLHELSESNKLSRFINCQFTAFSEPNRPFFE